MAHNGSRHKGGETKKVAKNRVRPLVMARAQVRRAKTQAANKLRIELRRIKRTCPKCGVVGKSLGRFLARHKIFGCRKSAA